jgi:hypothetical protein
MSSTAPTYEKFQQLLEGPFDEFVKSDEVNAYLQTIGPKIETEVLDMGILNNFTVVSGYGEVRGNWATAYENQIRFGDETTPVQGLKTPLILTPNFFYGKNRKGEELEYKMGLVKREEDVLIRPVVLRKTKEGIQAKILYDETICVIYSGLFVDSETAEQLGQEKVKEFTAYQQFITCFWNIDDYMRKQNPNFYSDFDTEVWEAVESFSGRIVSQMLHRITNKFLEDPDWMLPQAEAEYVQGLISNIESCMDVGNDISENQMITIVQNLCSYMSGFMNYQPLDGLAKKDLNIFSYIIENFKSPQWEVREEALEACYSTLKKTPHLITQESLNKISDMFSDESPNVRFKALDVYKLGIETLPHFIIQEGVSKIPTQFSDENHSLKYTAVMTYISAIENIPESTTEEGFFELVEASKSLLKDPGLSDLCKEKLEKKLKALDKC